MSTPNILELLSQNPQLFQALRQNLQQQAGASNQVQNLLNNPHLAQQLRATYQNNPWAMFQNPQLAAALAQQLRPQTHQAPVVHRPAPMSLSDIQARVLKELQSVLAERRGLSLQELSTRLDQNLVDNHPLLESLEKNPKIRIEDGKYYYVTKYDVRNTAELRQFIAHNGHNPLKLNDLEDSYPTVKEDIEAMTRNGEIIRIKSVDTMQPDVIFARDIFESNRVRLSGQLTLTKGSRIAKTSVDLTSEVFRNDVIIVQDTYFRVCSASESNAILRRMAPGEIDLTGPHPVQSPPSHHPHATAPGTTPTPGATPGTTPGTTLGLTPGATPIVGISKPYVTIGNSVLKTGGHFSVADTAPHLLPTNRSYVYSFTSSLLPLDNEWTGESGAYTAYRIGCSGDVRLLWRAQTVPNLAATVLLADQQMEGMQATVPGAVPGADMVHTNQAAAAGGGAGAGETNGGEAVGPTEGNGAESNAETAGIGGCLMTTLSDLLALENIPEFPATHSQLRAAMRKAGMNTLMAPGTLEASKMVPVRIGDQRKTKRVSRGLDIRSAMLKQSHLHGDILKEVEKTRQDEIRRALIRAKEERG